MKKARLAGALLSGLFVLGVCLGQENPEQARKAPREISEAELRALVDAKLPALAGEKAISCGHIPLRGDTKAAYDCAFKAFKEKKAFYIGYDERGIDSYESTGIAMDAKGSMYVVYFDSMGFDPSDHRFGGQLSDDFHVETRPCPTPYQLRIDRRNNYLTCFPPPRHATPPTNRNSPH